MVSRIDRLMNEAGAPDGLSQGLRKVLQTKDKIDSLIGSDIVFKRPIISLSDKGIVFPNTVTVIQGQKGVHKSRIVEILCATLLNNTPGKSFAGFTKSDPTKRYAVLYVDTERNITDQFPYALQQIKVKAGFSKTDKVSGFDYISLIDVERNQRFEVLQEYLEIVRKQYVNQHLVVVFDVITDCVESFNDLKESVQFIDMINRSINHHDVSFITVIHENPSSFNDVNKARGHLGTEIVNKASQVIKVGFEKDRVGGLTDIVKVQFLHSRNTKKPMPVFLQYDDASKSLIEATPDKVSEINSVSDKSKVPNDQLEKFMSQWLEKERYQSETIPAIQSEFNCGESSARAKIKELIDTGYIISTSKGKERVLRLKLEF